MICPKCGCTLEPEWRWKYIQQDEAYRIPTCPRCAEEMEEADACPLCAEPKAQDEIVCHQCWKTIVNGMQSALDRAAIKGTPELDKWAAAVDIASTIYWRFMRKKEREARE